MNFYVNFHRHCDACTSNVCFEWKCSLDSNFSYFNDYRTWFPQLSFTGHSSLFSHLIKCNIQGRNFVLFFLRVIWPFQWNAETFAQRTLFQMPSTEFVCGSLYQFGENQHHFVFISNINSPVFCVSFSLNLRAIWRAARILMGLQGIFWLKINV